MSELLAAILTAVAVLAPVPADPKPDPLAWGYLGVRVTPGSLRISSVEPGTPAAKAGIHPEDEIVTVGTLRPRAFEEVADHISSFRPGTTMKVEVLRNGEKRQYTVKLGVRPAEAGPPPPRPPRVPVPRDD